MVPNAPHTNGSFQYFLLVICPQPGSTAERMMARGRAEPADCVLALAPLMVDLALLRDTLAFARGVNERAGPVSRAILVGRPQALLMSADAMETVLGDTAGRVSAAGGWAQRLVYGGHTIAMACAQLGRARQRLRSGAMNAVTEVGAP